MNVITIKNLYKRFGEHEVLSAVNLEFESGQIYALARVFC